MLCLISGTNWDNGSISGVWALNLNNVRGNSNDNVGFRSDCIATRKSGMLPSVRNRESSLLRLAAKSVCSGLFSSHGDHQAGDFMKRIGSLFDAVISKDSLYTAYLAARRHKRAHRSCHEFERRLGAQIDDLHAKLSDGSYHPRPPNIFVVHEHKKRLIEAPAFRDLVVQHAIYQRTMPLFERRFIQQSFACRPGLGTHRAADYIQHALQQAPRTAWVLKVDCRKFFYSIDRAILRQQLERVIKDRRLLDVMSLFAHRADSTGIPIGNLLSQMYALVYLNELDHHIKRELKIVYYARYVDDLAMIVDSRAQGLQTQACIEAFLRDRLHLGVSKWSLVPIHRGINFCGYRMWASRRFVRRRALYVARKAIKEGNLTSLVSCTGHARRTHSLQHILSTTRSLNHDLYRSLPARIRRLHHLSPASATG